MNIVALVCDRASAAEELRLEPGAQLMLVPLDGEPESPGVTTAVQLGAMPARRTGGEGS